MVSIKSQKVAGGLLPGGGFLWGADPRQIIKPSQHGVAPAQSSQEGRWPKDHQPGGDQAFRIHRGRGGPKTLLPPLPISPAQKQGVYHCTQGVLKIGNQLDR